MQAATTAPPPAPLDAPHAFTHTPCYCEENVFLLLRDLLRHGKQADRLFALFISNTSETVPFWCQRASQQDDGLVIWDYHVIALEVPGAPGAQPLVWDLDAQPARLPCPCGLRAYAQLALAAGEVQLPPQARRRMRVVPAESLLETFASDRSHMLQRLPDGSTRWSAPPPPYSCIQAADGCRMNLQRYRDMNRDALQVGQQQQQQQHVGGSLPVVAAAAAAAVAEGASGEEAEPEVTWSDVVTAARGARFGVVVSEEVLLRCLLGQQQ